MFVLKSLVRLLCKPPASMKGDYRYQERKLLNISIMFQMLLSFMPAVISIFFDINYNPRRAMVVIPYYISWIFCMYKRWYGLLTISIMISSSMMMINYWTSVDRGILLFGPFFFLIFTSTFIPSRRFIILGYIFVFFGSIHIGGPQLINFLQTAPRDEIVVAFRKSFTTMLQFITMSFCHLLIKRYTQEKVLENLLALRNIVAAQNEELQKMNKQIIKALEGRETFILGFSHETRNPLNGIMGNLHLLSELELCSKAKQFLQKANICAKLLNNILLTILDSRRTGQSAVDITLKPQTVNMPNFIMEAWTLCKEMVRSKDVTPIIRISPQFPKWLVLDPERVTQVIMNLVSNAAKFTHQGYISLSLDWISETDDGHGREVTDSAYFTSYCAKPDFFNNLSDKDHMVYSPDWFLIPKTEQKGMLLISLKDTGCGISEADQKLILINSLK